MEGLQERVEIDARCAKLRPVDVRSSHQFEEEIGAASSENRHFIAKMEFSVRTGFNAALAELRAVELINKWKT